MLFWFSYLVEPHTSYYPSFSSSCSFAESTVLWKSNANELRRNWRFSWLFEEISLEKKSLRQFAIFRHIFMTSIVSILVNFHSIVRGVQQYAANFWVIIRSTRKFEANFRVKSRAFLCKVHCDVNRNHPSRCCSVTAWNISSITSCCSRKELKRAAEIKPTWNTARTCLQI